METINNELVPTYHRTRVYHRRKDKTLSCIEGYYLEEPKEAMQDVKIHLDTEGLLQFVDSPLLCIITGGKHE
jgi:hypothetical protein